jgi:hypothetical protein
MPGGLRKRPQLFSDELVERALRAEVPFDAPRRATLFDPDLFEAHDSGNDIVEVGNLQLSHDNVRVTTCPSALLRTERSVRTVWSPSGRQR